MTKKFYPVTTELSVEKGLLLRGNRLVIPTSLRPEVLSQLHVGHQGIMKCRERAKQAVWWLGLSKQLQELVQDCPVCYKHRIHRGGAIVANTFA